MNRKDNLPQEDFEKTVIINADDDITIKLPQEAGSPGSKSAAGSSSAAPGKLRNADREIKLSIASALPGRDMKMQVIGLDLKGGFPAEKEISSAIVEPAVAPLTDALATLILCCAERAPEELSADLFDEGVTLTGGGALLRGLDELITRETGMPVHVAENPLDCVVNGTGKCLDIGLTGNFRINR